MILIVSILLVAILLFLAIRDRRQRLSLLQRHGINCEPPNLFFGHFWRLKEKGNVLVEYEMMQKYGKKGNFGFYIGSTPILITKDIELIRRVQVKDFHLFPQRMDLGLIGGFEADITHCQALIHPEVPSQRWKEQRSLITSAFSSAKLKTCLPILNDAIDALLDNIKENVKEKDFDIYDLFQRLTMDTIGRAAFGIQTNVQRNPDDPFFKATKDIFEDKSVGLRHLSSFINMMFVEYRYIMYPFRWIQWRLLRPLGLAKVHYQHDVVHKIITQRRQAMFDPNNPWSRVDLLQQMIEAKMSLEDMSKVDAKSLTADNSITDQVTEEQGTSPLSKKGVHIMTDDEVASNAVLFFDAGFETTSTLLGFVTHVLVNDLRLQDRLREEVNELFKNEGAFDYNIMSKLPFMDAVINETLRMYPPVTDFVTRVASVDYEYGDITIPKGVSVQVGVHLLHHDPEHWPEPEKFDPYRFYGENKSNASSIAFQPFGGGPRNCVGLRFALMQAKLVLARLLLVYRLEPGPRTEIGDIERSYKPVTMCPKNGVFVKAIPIQ